MILQFPPPEVLILASQFFCKLGTIFMPKGLKPLSKKYLEWTPLPQPKSSKFPLVMPSLF